MCAGLSDRRADALDAGQRQERAHRIPRPRSAQRVPLLRRRLPAHLSHQERQAALRIRPRRPVEPAASVRERPLRLRLHQQSAAPDQADDPQGRRAESAARRDRPVQSVDAFPRSHVGGGARSRRVRLEENPRPRRLAGAGRLRLGQVLERRSLPVPEAGARRLRHQQRRSLHAAVPRLVGGGAARRRRLRRGVGLVQRMQEFRRHHRDRRQPDREPPRGRHLLQAGRKTRRQADRDGSARAGTQASRLEDDAVQERCRCGDAQRHAQRHRHRKALRPAIRADLCRRLRPVRREHQGLHAGGNGADLRRPRRHAARSRPHVCARAFRHYFLGHGRVAAHPRHRQCALPDRAIADHRPDRPARHRPASAARPEQRAGRLRRRPRPDVLPRLRFG